MKEKRMFYFKEAETGFSDFCCLFNHISGKTYELHGVEISKQYNGKTYYYYFTDVYTISNFKDRKKLAETITADSNSGFSCGSFDSFEEVVKEYPEVAELKVFF